MKSENRLNPGQALHLRDQFRDARLVALEDAEAFHDILFTLERLGYLLQGEERSLREYKEKIELEAKNSALAVEIPLDYREWHTPFSELYELVRIGRNDALHQGAFARS
jgi:hypothetical protein